jgi:uracil-DNA glycosylase
LVINILKQIGSINRDCIYVMWGAEAKKMREFVVSYSLQLEAPHPSPRAGLGTGRVFRGCRHFVLINQHLVKIGQKPIDWSTGRSPGTGQPAIATEVTNGKENVST